MGVCLGKEQTLLSLEKDKSPRFPITVQAGGKKGSGLSSKRLRIFSNNTMTNYGMDLSSICELLVLIESTLISLRDIKFAMI